MRMLLVALILVSTSLFAKDNDIIRVVHSSNAFCENEADVARYQTSGVYRVVKFENESNKISLTVEFLRCIKKNDSFLFVRDMSFEHRNLTIGSGPLSRDEVNVEIDRSEVEAVTFHESGRYVHNPMKKNADGTYSQTLPSETISVEETRDGERFFELSVAYKILVINRATGLVIDSKVDHLGTSRVYFK